MKNGKSMAADGFLTLLCLILCFGTKLWFHACGPKEDGSWMNCHWAQQCVFGIGLVLSVTAVLHFCVQNRKIKAGLSLGMVPTAVLAAILPSNLVPLCMMHDMRCHSVMRPAVMIVSIAIAATALFLHLRRLSQEDS